MASILTPKPPAHREWKLYTFLLIQPLGVECSILCSNHQTDYSLQIQQSETHGEYGFTRQADGKYVKFLTTLLGLEHAKGT